MTPDMTLRARIRRNGLDVCEQELTLGHIQTTKHIVNKMVELKKVDIE